MVIIELENESMRNFVLFVSINVEAKYPNIKNENGQSSPSRKISRKRTIIYIQMVVTNDCDQKDNQCNARSNP